MQVKLHSAWYNSEGECCKAMNPASRCFCDHALKLHTKEKVGCGSCKCKQFSCVPVHGSQDFKCRCKHSCAVHDPNKRTCNSCPCKAFTSTWSCTCGQLYHQHCTKNQSRQDKQARGETVHPTMGNVVSYSAILPQNERIGPSKKHGQIQEFIICKQPMLKEEISAWELSNIPLK